MEYTHLLVEGVVDGDVGSGESVDSSHVSTEIGTMTIVILNITHTHTPHGTLYLTHCISLSDKQESMDHFMLYISRRKSHIKWSMTIKTISPAESPPSLFWASV